MVDCCVIIKVNFLLNKATLTQLNNYMYLKIIQALQHTKYFSVYTQHNISDINPLFLAPNCEKTQKVCGPMLNRCPTAAFLYYYK